MTDIISQFNEEEQEDKTPPKLRVITGGKGPPEFTDDFPDWLSRIDLKTTFLCQAKKDTSPLLVQFTTLFKGEKAILMFAPKMSKEPEWFDPIRFCRDWRFMETIQTREEYEEEQKRNIKEVDGSNRSDRREQVEDFKTVEE